MTQLIPMEEHRKVKPTGKGQLIRFSRQELAQILAVYSGHVAAGEWRDYAINYNGRRAVFAVFRGAHEAPLFTISKLASGGRRGSFLVADAHRPLRQARTLAEALTVFKPALRLVKG